MPILAPRVKVKGDPVASSQQSVLWLAWLLTMSVSMLPEIVWQSATGVRPAFLFPVKIGIMVATFCAGIVWEVAQPLRRFCVLLAVLFLTEYLRGHVGSADWWRTWSGGAVSGFAATMLSDQVLRVLGACIMVGVLLVLRYRPRDFYLVKGNLDAPAAPIRWLGIARPVGWARLGMISAACISLGTLAFLLIGGRPAPAALLRALPLFPWVLLLAMMNAFAEEISYRSALLAPALSAIGSRHAILLTGIFFGIGHYYGVPYGAAGVAMASLLGWYLAKCMVETGGFLWPWFIHFLQDVTIFTFMAIGAVTPGGR